MSNTQSRIQEQIEREYQIVFVDASMPKTTEERLERELVLYENEKNSQYRKIALRGAEIALENQCKDVSRIEVIDEHGRQFVKYFKGECRIDYQDDNRTLKIFITPPKP